MRVGLVCPYAWTTPGGVQTHVSGLAGYLRSRGFDERFLEYLAGFRFAGDIEWCLSTVGWHVARGVAGTLGP